MLLDIQRWCSPSIESIKPRLARTCVRTHIRKHQPVSNAYLTIEARLCCNAIYRVARLAPNRVHALSCVVLIVKPPLSKDRHRLVLLLLHNSIHEVSVHAVVYVQSRRFGVGSSTDYLAADCEA
jgi:hypothetical protein